MRSFLAGIGASVVLASINTAGAADMAVKAPPEHPAATAPGWNGFYVGLNVGGGWGRRGVSFAPNDPATALIFALGGGPPATTFNESGVIGGLELGYNWQLSRNWLAGLETDFQWSAIKGASSTVFGNPAAFVAPIASTVSERIPSFGTVRARFGYMPTGNLLTYITGGFAYGRVEQNGNYVPGVGFTTNVPPFNANCGVAGSPCFAGSSSGVVAGPTAGGGFEYAISQNVRLKAEYLYVGMPSRSITETALAVTVPGSIHASFTANFARADFNIVRGGLNYKF